VLGPHDIGHRVVVRRHAGQQDGRQVFSDILGELVDLTETEITIRTTTRLARIPVGSVSHAKRVPRRRRLTATEALERVAASGWPAPEQDRLGDWLLRAAEGWTARGNSALPIGDPGHPLAAAVDAVQEWYRARQLPPKIAIADPVGGRLTAELTRRGWAPSPPTLVQTAALPAATTAALPDPEHHPRVRLDAAPTDAWLSAVATYKAPTHKGPTHQGPTHQAPAHRTPPTDEALPHSARHILTSVPAARFAGVYADDGSPLAVGRGVIADDDRRWLGISLVTVDRAYRRRGLGRAVVADLIGWAVAAGATKAYLQVEEHNATAVAMYCGLGFATHHAYVTWTAPGPG
jgi:GNAT superfamily N-acetyltransferase